MALSTEPSAVPTRQPMPSHRLPNAGLRTWRGGASETPIRMGAAPPSELLHALQRMSFGLRPEDAERINSMTLMQYVDEQLDPTLADSDCDAIIAGLGHQTQNLTLSQLWAYRSMGYPTSYYPWWEVREETIVRMVHSNRQLFEVMVDFWHNHFNIRAGNYPERHVWRSYDRDVIRTHAYGNFRLFLEKVGQHTAMLYYLDNVASTNAGPNENYARELFELHALGAEHYLIPGGYTDEDVFEAARCFTGWSVNNSSSTGNTGEFLYKEENHDRFQKFVMGVQIPRDQPPYADGHNVYDILANHPMVHRHIALKLCQRFVADEPPESLVDYVAQIFGELVADPNQIRWTLRAMFLHPDFVNSWQGKIKRPLDFLASSIRAMGASFEWSNEWEWNTDPLNQEPFDWPSPNGYPDTAAAWINTNGMLHRWNVINDIVLDDIDGVSVDLLGQTPGHILTPNQIVDFWIDRILHRSVASHMRQALLDFVSEGRNADLELPQPTREMKIPSLVALILSSPDFQYR